MKNEFQFAKNTTFLVTGGAGFIGSNLCESILARGYSVRCMDDFSTGYEHNIAEFRENARFSLMNASVTDYAMCVKACEGVDYVLHHAAMGSVPKSVELPVDCARINVEGTLNILQAARECSVKGVVYASSSAVYGEGAPLPQKEGLEGRILSPYALSKASNERWASLYTSLYGLPTVGLRYFNVYGKRQDPNGAYAAVIPQFLEKLLSGQSPTIFGDGKQMRDFIYVGDVVRANLMACMQIDRASGDVFNVASAKQYTLLELFDCIASLLHTDIQPEFAPARAGDVKLSGASIEKLKTKLGFSPNYSFEEGLRLTAEWFRRNI